MTPPMTPPGAYQYDKIPPPKNLRQVPAYLGRVLGGFFSRLLYICGLVWKSGPIFLILMSFIALFNGVMPLLGALLSQEILNLLQDVVTQTALGKTFDLDSFLGSTVLLLLIFFFVYKILNKVIARLSVAVNRLAGERVVRHVKLEIMRKAQELDLSSFDRPAFYEKLENANREAGHRPITILSSTFDIISNFISLVGYLLILMGTLPFATLAIALMAIPSTVVNFIYRRKTFQYMRHRSLDRRQMNYYADLSVNKDLAKELRMYNLGGELTERYDGVFHRYYRGLKSLIVRENVWQVVFAVLSALLNCFFFAMIALGVFRGDYRIGDYSLYTGALTSVAASIGILITSSASVYEGTLFIDNLLSFLKEKSHIVPRRTPALLPTRGSAHTLELRNVSFTYPDGKRPVLDRVSLRLEARQSVALVGLNGAGKTTLIKLLTRLYDPDEGEILLDGKDLRDYDPTELRRLFGIVFQDFGKYAASAADNITFGDLKKTPDPEKIRTAARHAGAAGLIERLPQGYDTQLMRYFDRNGTELSGGEWQKLSLARAFYSDADIFILDEPTAALDPMAEQEVFRQFDELRGDKLTLFVSHRLSSATTASKVVVLDGGRVIEEGSHAELMAKNGKYAALFRTQAERYREKNESENKG